MQRVQSDLPDWVALNQFSFWENHSTAHEINQILEYKEYYKSVSHSLPKICCTGLLFKITKWQFITYLF